MAMDRNALGVAVLTALIAWLPACSSTSALAPSTSSASLSVPVAQSPVNNVTATSLTPTLVVSGTRDSVVPPANSRLLARRIPGASLVMLPGGHDLQRAESARALARVVDGFLNIDQLNIDQLNTDHASSDDEGHDHG